MHQLKKKKKTVLVLCTKGHCALTPPPFLNGSLYSNFPSPVPHCAFSVKTWWTDYPSSTDPRLWVEVQYHTGLWVVSLGKKGPLEDRWIDSRKQKELPIDICASCFISSWDIRGCSVHNYIALFLLSFLLASQGEHLKLISLWYLSRNTMCDPTDPRLRTGVLYSAFCLLLATGCCCCCWGLKGWQSHQMKEPEREPPTDCKHHLILLYGQKETTVFSHWKTEVY